MVLGYFESNFRAIVIQNKKEKMLSAEVKNKYELVIGLEVHAQLLTQSKMYTSDSTEYGNLPNLDERPQVPSRFIGRKRG